jgi:methylenetetrahydrofolate reductase (NADPH)
MVKIEPQGERSSPDAAASAKQAIIALLRGASVELAPREQSSLDACAASLHPGTSVYINCTPATSYHDSVATALRLRRAGFNPVPHVAARYLMSYTQLADYLARASGEAGVDQVLVIGGDADRPAGPFDSALQLVATGLFERYGIRHIGIAGYPSGHPKISSQALTAALVAKLALLQQSGCHPYLVTQFVFEAPPILEWMAQIRRFGIDVRTRIGLAAPASIATLAKFAVRCGVGNSIRALVKRQASVTRLLTVAGPEQIIGELAQADPAGLGITGLHLFTFGGIARTGAWLAAIEQGKIELASTGKGFTVTR